MNGRCWVRAYVCRKNESTPPPPPPPGLNKFRDNVDPGPSSDTDYFLKSSSKTNLEVSSESIGGDEDSAENSLNSPVEAHGENKSRIATEGNHTGKCIRRFGGTCIYAHCRYFIDRKW